MNVIKNKNSFIRDNSLNNWMYRIIHVHVDMHH